ncbi:UDP-3-O-(3-hydroxymyristoyl)glucosamine N-acyltransferase [bacterium endosymbiont of Escarpia laminata]|nr:MAG: UDP-3-O-(3-hydroxymyristoyl)glucosamine N-acyltransferase [bacterium endosymbiont of Escarpia laminata]RLJ18279.1 MAG: UDP-3-O-(3-hydroxymyristoyl)glucosamine N-acyltransferase [bacterium endosymbiont of Escarpia laminata]
MAVRLGVLAEIAGAELRGDPQILISKVATLQQAGPDEVSFLANPKYRCHLKKTAAAAVILRPEDAEYCTTALLLSDNPYLAYARVSRQLNPVPVFEPGCHASAVVDTLASIDPSAFVGPCAVVGAGSRIGAGVYIGPGCIIEHDCVVADESRLVANVTLCHGTHVGERCLIHPGAVLGSDGFGLANDEGRWEKVPQTGRVRLGNDVEVGANTTIDRGALEDTVLEDGVKLDNLIQIAHNVIVGANTAMASGVAVAGSTHIGRNCTLGGMVGLVGHLDIGDNVHFSGASMVTRSFSEPGYYSGNLPAMDNKQWRKAVARIRQLDEMAKRLQRLEKKVETVATDQDG